MRHHHNLYSLSLVHIFERFSFYGLLSLLVVYGLQTLGMNDVRTYALFGNFVALSYLLNLIGGRIADKSLGYTHCVSTGLLFIVIGSGIIFLNSNFVLWGLALFACGVGFYESSMSSLIGSLYKTNEHHSARGYTFLYICTNVGSLLGILTCTFVYQHFQSNVIFILIALSALIGLMLFHWRDCTHLDSRASIMPLPHILSSLVILCMIVITYYLLNHETILGIILIVATIACCVYLFRHVKVNLHNVILVLVFNATFIILYMQSKTSLTMFSLNGVYRNLFSITLPAAALQMLNPIFILLIGPLIMMLWSWLAKNDIAISISSKYSAGLLFSSLAFGVLAISASHFQTSPLLILVIAYFLLTLAELLIGPVGLHTILRSSPKNSVAFMMGIWNLSYADANYLSSELSKITSISSYSNEFIISFAIGLVAAVVCCLANFSIFTKYKSIS